MTANVCASATSAQGMLIWKPCETVAGIFELILSSLHKQHPNSSISHQLIKSRNRCFEQARSFGFEWFPFFGEFGIAISGTFVHFRNGAFCLIDQEHIVRSEFVREVFYFVVGGFRLSPNTLNLKENISRFLN